MVERTDGDFVEAAPCEIINCTANKMKIVSMSPLLLIVAQAEIPTEASE
jgi:hypothetical protein